MASAGGRKNPAVIDRLLAEPQGFDFFQAVRLLEAAARQRGDSAGLSFEIGRNGPPHAETIRFRSLVALAFPGSEVVQLTPPPALDVPSAMARPVEMTTSFFGLIGPNGVLPTHYTRLLIERLRSRDPSLRDWLDMFHHRALSLYFRAWEKHRFFLEYERLRNANSPRDDRVTTCLYAFTGLGQRTLRDRLAVDDEAVLYYSGLFARYPRPAVALEWILKDYFEVPLEIEQFVGQWLTLAIEDRSMLPGGNEPDGRNCRLGMDAIAGDRVWDVQSRFRVRIGPVGYETFQAFFPTGSALLGLVQFTRLNVGPDVDFEVQVVLKGDETPWCHLGEAGQGAYLGWNTWVRNDPFVEDVDDAVFDCRAVEHEFGVA